MKMLASVNIVFVVVLSILSVGRRVCRGLLYAPWDMIVCVLMLAGRCSRADMV
jgi:hypothetical protein